LRSDEVIDPIAWQLSVGEPDQYGCQTWRPAKIATDASLIRNGFIPFGKGPDVDYDPVCFDLTSRKKNADYGIVKIDHEEILCNERIQVVGKLAPSFEELVVPTIERGTTPN
jgi:hypothetical protein